MLDSRSTATLVQMRRKIAREEELQFQEQQRQILHPAPSSPLDGLSREEVIAKIQKLISHTHNREESRYYRFVLEQILADPEHWARHLPNPRM